MDQKGIPTSDTKTSAVKNFPTAKNVGNVRSFPGLAGYYRAFVEEFASTACLPTRLLKKDVSFLWQDAKQQSFDTLKLARTNTSVLTFPNY